MKPYRRLGVIKNPNDLLKYCQSLNLQSSTRSYSAEKGRLEGWIKYGSNLRSMKPVTSHNYIEPVVQHKILTYSSGYVTPPTNKIEELGKRVMERGTNNPIWHSCFVTNNGGIGWHRDHGIFEHWGVIINLGSDAILEIANNFRLEVKDGDITNKSVLKLKHGQIITLNTKCLHRATIKDKSSRYMMLFHRFKDGWEKHLPEATKRIYERIASDSYSS